MYNIYTSQVDIPTVSLSIAQRSYALPQSIPESKSDASGTDTIEDEVTETSELMSEDDDEHHQTEKEDEDAEAGRWYRDLGLTRDEADELFIVHLQELVVVRMLLARQMCARPRSKR